MDKLGPMVDRTFIDLLLRGPNWSLRLEPKRVEKLESLLKEAKELLEVQLGWEDNEDTVDLVESINEVLNEA